MPSQAHRTASLRLRDAPPRSRHRLMERPMSIFTIVLFCLFVLLLACVIAEWLAVGWTPLRSLRSRLRIRPRRPFRRRKMD